MCRRIFKEQTSENGEIPFYKIGTFGGEADAFISRELFEEYKAKYQYPKKGDILISASGSIGRTVVFTGKNEYFQDSNIVWLNHDKHLDNSFLKCFYSIVKWAGIEGSTIKRLYNDNILNTAITLPSVEEQQKIGAYFENLDNLITLHQCKCQIDGYRFQSPLAITWEQRKFSDLVQIERGGSPRPIDDFITDSPDGLNWVKIGDAPAQGNYITKTAEKIKPEGLSKTREVHPGDLILSNSMSFGKPYIMGIDGCIHDGWLLIRNTYKAFDLTFLCHLLGTPQMIIQYKSLAAGSTVNNLNKELVGNTVVTIPTIKEQRVLGQYLETLDNLITLHQRKYDKLTNVKKSMLEKMFPQNGSNAPEIRFKGFTEAWEQRKLSDCAGFRRGSFPQPYGNKDWYDGEGAMPFVQVADVSDDMKLVDDTKQKISKLAQPMSVCAEEGSVLVTLQGSIGRVAIMQYKAFVDRTVLIFDKYNADIDKTFWAYIIKEKFIEEARKAPGGTIKTITKEVLSDFDLMLPSYDEQKMLGKLLHSLDHLITLHQRELEKLQNIKKSMLEKMFV